MLFERQKSLLTLLDALGGDVANVDFQKLLFLWNRKLGDSAYYDFVPFRYGAFSHTSYADRRKLVEKGLLVDNERAWTITPDGKAILSGHTVLRQAAEGFATRAPKLRGDALVALTYRQYPFFAIRSEIASRVLADDLAAQTAIDDAKPGRRPPGIVTIGYEGRSLEKYLVALLKEGVSILCDVRRNPLSRRYGFSKSSLAKACEGLGLRYEHLPDLGIPSEDRRGLETQADYDSLFDAYERDALPLRHVSLALIAGWVADGERVALTCFESLPQQCHRHCVADALEREYGGSLSPTHL